MINVKDLKKDQVVYECERGYNLREVCLEDARRVDDPKKGMNGWACLVRLDSGKEIELFADVSASHYGPKLYSEKQYAEPRKRS